MDGIYVEKTLNRIIQGRLRVRLGDLVLYVYEPNQDLLEESYEVYEEAKRKAYFSGNYIQDEVVEILVNNDLWTPLDDQRAKEMESGVEELKVEAFKNFYKKKELFGIKRNIRNIEANIVKLKNKRLQLDHITCDGVAKLTRMSWLIQNTTRHIDNTPFDFKECPVSNILETYQSEAISSTMYREIARSQYWRSIWNSSKQRGDVFGKPSIDLDQQQLALISYSIMYDNVFESTESPKEEVVNDDDCLDGWFIVQRRKYEKQKKEAEVESMLSNSKIANSQEIFLVAKNQEEASDVYSLNSMGARTKVRQRQNQIKESGHLHFKDLDDVKQERMMNAVNTGASAIKRIGR